MNLIYKTELSSLTKPTWCGQKSLMASVIMTGEMVHALQSLDKGYRDLCNEFELRIRKLYTSQYLLLEKDSTDPNFVPVDTWSNVVRFLENSGYVRIGGSALPTADQVCSFVLDRCDFMDYELLEAIENTSLKGACQDENSQLSHYQSQLNHFKNRTDVKRLLKDLVHIADRSTGGEITVTVAVYHQYGYVTRSIIINLVRSVLSMYFDFVGISFKHRSLEEQSSGKTNMSKYIQLNLPLMLQKQIKVTYKPKEKLSLRKQLRRRKWVSA